MIETTNSINIKTMEKKFCELKLSSAMNNQNSLKNLKILENTKKSIKNLSKKKKKNSKQFKQINAQSICLNKNNKCQQEQQQQKQQNLLNTSIINIKNKQNKNIQQCNILKNHESTSSTTTSNDEFDKNNIENNNKFVMRRINHNFNNDNNCFDFQIVRRNRRRNNKHYSKNISKLLTDSTSTCSLASNSSSSSSGFGASESSNNKFLLNETKIGEKIYTKETLEIKRKNLSPSISVSSTLSSNEFSDHQENSAIYLDLNQNSNDIKKNQEIDSFNIKSDVNAIQQKCDKTKKIENFESITKFQNDLNNQNNFENQSNANLIFYNPFLFNNYVNDINCAQYFQQKSQNFTEVSSLLNNPKFKIFFNNHKQYYRKIYDQQFAACKSTLFEQNLTFNPITSNKSCQNISFNSKDGISYRQNGVMIWRRNGVQKTNFHSNQKDDFNKKKNCFKYKHTLKQYYLPHQHLGFPICLPYTALYFWEELGLIHEPCNQLEKITKNNSQYYETNQETKPKMMYSPSLIIPTITPFNPFYLNNQFYQISTDILPIEQNIE